MVEKITNITMEIIGRFRSNYLAEYHVRELAKLMQKNHATIIPHLKALGKSNVLKFKREGKNKVYSINLDNIMAKEYIIMAEKNTTINYLNEIALIKRIFAEIGAFCRNSPLIIFGSYAQKAYTKESDIDMILIGNVEENAIASIKKIGKIYGKSINIKTASLQSFEKSLRSKDALISEIIKNHIILQNAEIV